MHVYGDLIALHPSNQVVVPWYCRAPLGLRSRSSVYLALVDSVEPATSMHQASKSLQQRLPDLIVSTLDPMRWDQTLVFLVDCLDDVGVVQTTLEELRALNEDKLLNIAIGESATLTGSASRTEEATRRHEFRLFLQSYESDGLDKTKARIDQWRARLGRIGAKLTEERFVAPGRHPRPLGNSEIVNGIITLREPWKRIQEAEAQRAKRGAANRNVNLDHFDLSALAVTADLRSRSVRFIAPRRGARRVRSVQRDVPNVLAAVVDVVKRHRHNILAHHLRKMDSAHGEFNAVCEPIDPLVDKDALLCDEDFLELLNEHRGIISTIRVFPPASGEEVRQPGTPKPTPRALQRQMKSDLDASRAVAPVEDDCAFRLPEEYRELLEELAEYWHEAKPVGKPETTDDRRCARLLIRLGTEVLRAPRIISELNAYECSPRTHRQEAIALWLGGATENLDSVFSHVVRGTVKGTTDRLEYDLFDLGAASASKIETIHALARASALVIAVPPPSERSPTSLPQIASIAFAYRLLNWNAHLLFVVERGDEPLLASSGFVAGADVRRYRWPTPTTDLTGNELLLKDVTNSIARNIRDWLRRSV